ncbi:MAG: hypothetical protein IPO47_15405 [Bacteroidetes bacterium]|nr:hypothetical protein [Bacteroidota bacterium]MBK9557182.1 hypothetical protein [Bacteroidota bacterium]
MAKYLPEEEFKTINQIFEDNKRKVTAIKNVEIPKYLLNLFKNSGYTKDVVKQEDILKILRNRAVLFLFMKLQNTEMLQALIGNGESSLTAFASNIATGDYSHIFKIISSPKAKEAFGFPNLRTRPGASF